MRLLSCLGIVLGYHPLYLGSCLSHLHGVAKRCMRPWMTSEGNEMGKIKGEREALATTVGLPHGRWGQFLMNQIP